MTRAVDIEGRGVRVNRRSVGVGSAIPDSVEYQVRVEEFASPWPFNIGSTDMTVNGLSSSTFANGEAGVVGESSNNDYGEASGPNNLPENQTFGVAFTMQIPSGYSGDRIFGVGNTAGQDTFDMKFQSGKVSSFLGDGNDNRIAVETDSTFDDGSPHAVIFNKNGNSVSDLSVYVDDMATEQSTTNIDSSSSYDHTTYSQTHPMVFFARESEGIDSHIDLTAGIFEFKTSPYSLGERDNFVSRRPEV